MSRRRNCLAGAAAVALVLAGVFSVHAETCKLELQRLSARGESVDPLVQMLMNLCQTGSSPSFFMQISRGGQKNPYEAEFVKIVTKQPKYHTEHPLRGVVELGSHKYAFAFDTKDAKSSDYCRFHFDFNHNGDLTDDKPIAGELSLIPTFGSSSQFPRIDVAIDVKGQKVDYGFFIRLFTNSSGDFKYASCSLSPAVYREGQIMLDGKPRRVYLLDLNCNGRFDDEISIRDNVSGVNGEVYPLIGDSLAIDPDVKNLMDWRLMRESQQYVSKLTAIDGRYYDMKVAPSGDTLTLTPSAVPLGQVTSPHAGFRASLIGDQGYVPLRFEKGKPAAVPQGDWRLISYTIDRTGLSDESEPKAKDAKAAAAKKDGSKGSLLGLLWGAITGDSANSAAVRRTSVTAAGAAACPVLKVRQGQTLPLPFGPPYRPVVTTMPYPDKSLRLELAIVGASGEVVNNIDVDGTRPPPPAFTVSNPKGEVVLRGNFQYG